MNITSLSFISLMSIVLIFGLLTLKTKKVDNLRIVIPSILSTLGILGTFMGIIIGLMHFDTRDISGSIPLLLDGLNHQYCWYVV